MSDSASQLQFKIDGMDCAEEVAVLKRAVGPLVGGEERLGFDLLKGRMVVAGGSSATAEQVRQAVARTGMTAQPWRSDGAAPPAGFWSRHGRTVLGAASGVLLAAAFVAHALGAGGVAAALGAEGAATPWPAIALYLLAIVAGGWYIAPKAVYAVRSLRPDMNLLMTVAVAGAIGLGEWFEAATVTFLFAVALLLERWSVGRARHAIERLLELAPEVARVVDPATGEVAEQPVEEVAVGAVVRVRPGDKVPLDGEVLSGSSAVDQSPITGESMPVGKERGDEVYAGTVNGDGALDVEVTRPAEETTLAHIIHLVEEAQARRAPSEQWVERFARVYTPLMMALAAALAVLPPLFLGGGWGTWFYRALVLLVIGCPCALVISTPVSVVAALAAAARSGVLIKGGSFLEAPARWRALAFDKTGTLTEGEPKVQRILPLDEHSEEELLARAAALEAESTHPFARAILETAAERGVSYTPAAGLTVLPGRGAEGELDGRRFWIGSHRLLEESGLEDEAMHRQALELEDAGHSVVVVGNERHVCGLLSIADGVRPAAAETLAELRRLGLERLVMLTGDNRGTAEAVAAAVGVDEVHAELLPADKVALVERLTGELGQVAMVGDGVNDAPALAASSTGVAMGTAGSDAAIETADVALMADDLPRLPWLVRHSRRALAVIRQNIVFALAVKALFVLLAALGLATLWMAIAADMGASLLVIANGLRLLKA